MTERPARESDVSSDRGMRLLNSAPIAFSCTLLLTLLVPLILFYPIRGFTFSVIDDQKNIVYNPYLCNLSTQNIGFFWTHAYYDLYMPLTYTLWALLARVGQLPHPVPGIAGNAPTTLNPGVYHTASLILHLLNVGLVFLILQRLRFRPWECAAGTLLFAVHPVQIQAVAWITGMNNLLSAFFGLLALYLYLRQVPDFAAPDVLHLPRRALVLQILATTAFALALLSKPTATVFPLFIAIFEIYIYRRPWRVWRGMFGCWLLLSVICSIGTRVASGHSGDAVWSPLWGRPFAAGDALAFYLVKLVAPINLCVNYVRSPRFVLSHPWGYLTWLLPAACALLVWRIREESGKPQWWRASALVFVAGLLPTLGFVVFYTQWETTVADRFLYVAFLGPALAFAAGIARFRQSKLPITGVARGAAAVTAAVVVLTGLFSVSLLEIPVWTNDFSLTADTMAKYPDSGTARQCLAVVLCDKGDWSDAYVQLQLAQRLLPTTNSTLTAMRAMILWHLGRRQEALTQYVRAVQINPENETVWFELMNAMAQSVPIDAQEAFVQRFLTQHPDMSWGRMTLGAILLQKNEARSALPLLQQAVRSDPSSADNQYFLGLAWEQLGETDAARACYQEALRINPYKQNAATALAHLRSTTH